MISRNQAAVQLDECERLLPQLYSGATGDYRGRAISLETVRNYLRVERERFLDVVTLWPDPPTLGARLLDVGVAYGFISVLLHQTSGWECEGLEVEENIPVYCQLAQKKGIRIHSGKLGTTSLDFESGSFQGVIFSEVLEHLRLSPHGVFRELNRILAPGGFLLVTTPNFARVTNVVKMMLGRNPLETFPDVVAENITEHLTHIREYTMSELESLLSATGFHVERAEYSSCMERGRSHGWLTSLVSCWRGDLMVLAKKR